MDTCDTYSFITAANNIINSLHTTIMDPSNKFTKEQMGKLSPKLSELLGNISLVAAKMGFLEGELKTYQRISENQPLQPSLQSPTSGTQIAQMCEAADELEERKVRAKNLIFTNVPESVMVNQMDRIKQDKVEVLKILNKIDTTLVENSVVNVFRIGTVKPNKIRPIKVILNDPSITLNVLRRKNIALTHNDCKIYSDQTPLQRQYLNELRQTLANRTLEGEVGLTIKFINNKPAIVNVSKNQNPPLDIA